MEQMTSILEIGKRIIIGVHEGSGERQYISRIADMEIGVIAVTMPTEQMVLRRFEQGTPLTIYVSDLTAMYAFKTTALAEQLVPVALLTISAPSEITRIQRRQYVRMDVHLGPVDISISAAEPKAEEKTVSSIVVNISAGGMRFVTKDAIAPSSQAKAVLEIPQGFGKVEVTGLILRVETKGEGKNLVYEASAQFANITEKDKDKITQFIFRQQSDLRKRGLI